METVYKAIMEAVEQIPEFLKEPEPFVKISNYLESSIEYVVRVWAKTDDYWTGYYKLLEGVKKAFDKYGVEMPYNHLNVHVTSN